MVKDVTQEGKYIECKRNRLSSLFTYDYSPAHKNSEAYDAYTFKDQHEYIYHNYQNHANNLSNKCSKSRSMSRSNTASDNDEKQLSSMILNKEEHHQLETSVSVLHYRKRLVQHEIRRLRRKFQIRAGCSLPAHIRPSEVKLIQAERNIYKRFTSCSYSTTLDSDCGDSARLTPSQTSRKFRNELTYQQLEILASRNKYQIQTPTMVLPKHLNDSSNSRHEKVDEGTNCTKRLNGVSTSSQINSRKRYDNTIIEFSETSSKTIHLFDDTNRRGEKRMHDEKVSRCSSSVSLNIITEDKKKNEHELCPSVTTSIAFDPFPPTSTADDFYDVLWGQTWSDLQLFDKVEENDLPPHTNRLVVEPCSLSDDDFCSKATVNTSNVVHPIPKISFANPAKSNSSSISSKSKVTKRYVLQKFPEIRRIPFICNNCKQNSRHDSNRNGPSSLSTDQTSCRSISSCDNPKSTNNGRISSNLTTDKNSLNRRRISVRQNNEQDSERSVGIIRNLVAPCVASKMATKEWLRSANMSEEHFDPGSYQNSMEMVFFEEIQEHSKYKKQ